MLPGAPGILPSRVLPWLYPGTLYQYEPLRIMVDLVFQHFEDMPVYTLDFPVMFLSPGSFLAVYALIMYGYRRRIRKIKVKKIMPE